MHNKPRAKTVRLLRLVWLCFSNTVGHTQLSVSMHLLIYFETRRQKEKLHKLQMHGYS